MRTAVILLRGAGASPRLPAVVLFRSVRTLEDAPFLDMLGPDALPIRFDAR
jgi:hypothetical protein